MTRYGNDDSTQIVELQGGGHVLAFVSNNGDGTVFLNVNEDGSAEDGSQSSVYLTTDELLELAQAAIVLQGQVFRGNRQPARLDYRREFRPATK